jgi:hypothetical protein
VLTHSLAGQESCRWTKFFIYFFWEKKGQESKQSDGHFRGAAWRLEPWQARHALVCCLFVFLAAGGTSVRCLCCSLSRPRRRWQGWLLPPGVQRALPACLVCFMHHRRHILRRSDGSWSKKEKKKPVGAAPLTSVPIDVHAVVVCRRQNAQARSKTRGYCRGHETLQCRAGDPAGSPPHAPCSNVTSPSAAAAAAAASTLVTGGNLSRPTALAWRPGLRSQVTTRANDVNSSLVASAPPRRAAGRQSDNFPVQTVVVTVATTTTTTSMDDEARRVRVAGGLGVTVKLPGPEHAYACVVRCRHPPGAPQTDSFHAGRTPCPCVVEKKYPCPVVDTLSLPNLNRGNISINVDISTPVSTLKNGWLGPAQVRHYRPRMAFPCDSANGFFFFSFFTVL